MAANWNLKCTDETAEQFRQSVVALLELRRDRISAKMAGETRVKFSFALGAQVQTLDSVIKELRTCEFIDKPVRKFEPDEQVCEELRDSKWPMRVCGYYSNTPTKETWEMFFNGYREFDDWMDGNPFAVVQTAEGVS